MTVSPLKFELHSYGALRRKLLDSFPDVDEETLRDTLEGLTSLNELVAEVIRSALLDAALQIGLKTRLEDLKHRLSRIEQRETKKRQLALEAMIEAGLTKLEQPDFTASSRASPPALVVVAETEIPEAYWVPQPSKLDRANLLAALKRGTAVPGAQLSNAKPALTVRTK